MIDAHPLEASKQSRVVGHDSYRKRVEQACRDKKETFQFYHKRLPCSQARLLMFEPMTRQLSVLVGHYGLEKENRYTL